MMSGKNAVVIATVVLIIAVIVGIELAKPESMKNTTPAEDVMLSWVRHCRPPSDILLSGA